VILEEMYQQLLVLYPGLPPPPIRLLSATAYYSDSKWHERDSAFIHTVKGEYFPSEAVGVSGLYQIGTQNGNSSFAYTTFEAAVTNAIEWSNKHNDTRIVIHNPMPLSRVIWIGVIVLLTWIALKKLREK
jgi:hypothetical protein